MVFKGRNIFDRSTLFEQNKTYLKSWLFPQKSAIKNRENRLQFMRGLNKISLIGNVGKDPEIHTLDKNIKVAKFSLATTESYRDDSGQMHSSTDWHTIILWRGLAELAEKYLRKGSLVFIEGKLKYRSYDDKDGQKKYVAEIIGDQIILLDKKTDGTSDK